jgi:flagellar hook-associated protein 1 FlgK
MATIGSVVSSALSSLQANQFGISVTSNNIANANNLNYSRQRMVTAPVVDMLGTSGGLGVQVLGVEALRDPLIQKRLLQEDAARSGADLLNRTLGDIEVFFSDINGAGLQQYISDFFTSFQTLSTDPSSSSFRQLVQTRGEALAAAFRETRSNLAQMRNQANSDATRTVETINSLASQIAQVSAQIRYAENTGQANELRDRRTALARELAAITEVHELESDGTYQLSIAGNRLLVMESETLPLTTAVDPLTGLTQIFTGVTNITAEFTTGELGATLQLRDSYIPGYLTALDDLAYNLVQEVNTRHSAGYNLLGGTGVNFFTPLASSNQAASLIAVDPAILADTRNIAASADADGFGNQTATAIGNLIFESLGPAGSLLDQYGALVFAVGSDVSASEIAVREHEALSTQLEMRRQAMSGVSIDEETVQMLQFQRAYQASAQLLSAVDEMLQAILAIGA